MRSVLKASALLPIGLLLLGGGRAGSEEVSVPLTVTRNEARGSFELPGGFGADVTISFEDVIGLHPRSLVVFASVVDPTDPELLERGGDAGRLEGALRFPQPRGPAQGRRAYAALQLDRKASR